LLARTTFFPKQPELQAYICSVAAEYDIMDKFHLSTVVKEARWDEASSLWHVYTEDLPERETKEGVKPQKHHYVCRFFVSCIGGLSSPNSCNIEGHENFKGPM
jgi:cation diffusion facilitator CzcD-associated flavoprotein CzcO